MRPTIFVTPVAAATAILLLGIAGPASAGTNTVVFQDDAEHAITIPSGVTAIHVVAVGGKGGGGSGNHGGFGARVTGTLAVTPGATRYLVVGGSGVLGDYGSGGGGASDVRTASVSAGLVPDTRVLIAAGGGGVGRGIFSNALPMLGNGGNAGQPGQDSAAVEGRTGSGGGAAGVPVGTGAGGASGAYFATPQLGDPGLPGALGVGGAGGHWGAPPVGIQGYGGFNGGGRGGGGSTVSAGGYIHLGGGGGGGGLHGGGGGGGALFSGNHLGGGGGQGGGGGGGGSNLVPAGGAAVTDATGATSITVSFNDTVAPTVTLAAVPSRVKGENLTVSGTGGVGLGDGGLTVDVYAGAAVSGSPVLSVSPGRGTDGTWQESRFASLSEGTHTVRVRQVDGGGNTGFSVARTVVIDNSTPQLTLGSPASGAAVSGSATFSGLGGTATGDASTVTIELRNASGGLITTFSGQRHATTGAFSIPASLPYADGSYWIVARQSDDVGNVASTPSARLVLDSRAPEPTLASPASAHISTRTPTFTGTGTTASGDSGTVDVKIYAGASASGSVLRTQQATLVGGAYSISTASLPDGMYTAQTSQADTAGNVGRSTARTFTVDTVAPVVALTDVQGVAAPALTTFTGSGSTVTGDETTVAVALHAGDSTAGPLITTVDAPRDGQTGTFIATVPFGLAAGTYTVVAAQRDHAGNVGTSSVRTFQITASAIDEPGVTPPVVEPPVLVPPSTDPPVVVPPVVVPPSIDPPVGDPPLAVDTIKPSLSRVGLSAKRFTVGTAKAKASSSKGSSTKRSRGTTVRYTLSEPATVTFAVTRKGRAKAIGTFQRRSVEGTNRYVFSGKIGSRSLKRGAYRLTLRAVDPAGNRGAAKTVSFRIG